MEKSEKTEDLKENKLGIMPTVKVLANKPKSRIVSDHLQLKEGTNSKNSEEAYTIIVTDPTTNKVTTIPKLGKSFGWDAFAKEF